VVLVAVVDVAVTVVVVVPVVVVAVEVIDVVVPSVFGRNLQCQPVRRVNTREECHWIPRMFA
jgi:hypothetical protein